MKEDKATFGTPDLNIKFDQKILKAHSGEPPKIFRSVAPKIDLGACQNNYNCIIFCPYDAIDKNEKGRPVIDYNKCTGCLICLRECPTAAISEVG